MTLTTKSALRSVDEYIRSFPPDVQVALDTVRRTIRHAVPRAEESISYNMPAYKIDGRRLLYFAAYKQHYSIFGATPPLYKAFAKELAAFDGTTRGTLRFPLDEPVPVGLIRKIARFRADEHRRKHSKSD
jgi:uncharacterized protein YdhG (YjbR/CyaY superfamily)